MGSVRTHDRSGARRLAWQRVAATGVDYGLVGLWGAALAGLAVALGAGRGMEPLSAGRGQLLGLATMTVPATLLLALAEASGGSPGKRLLGLRLQAADGQRAAFGAAVARTAAKVALPWELAHTGVWQFATGGHGALALGSTAAAYGVLGMAAVGLSSNAPWYDHLCGTRVVRRCAVAEPRSA